jgi:DIS3-like exonuclease 2
MNANRFNENSHSKPRFIQKHFDEFLEDEKKIEMGIEKGYYFEGVIRINQNNRKRAFVNVNGMKMDVMIDGLQC